MRMGLLTTWPQHFPGLEGPSASTAKSHSRAASCLRALSCRVGYTDHHPSETLKTDFLLTDLTPSFLSVTRNGKDGKESRREVILREPRSIVNPVIVTVAEFLNGCTFFRLPLIERRGLMSLAPESGWACDCFNKSVCDFQGWVIKGHVASAWAHLLLGCCLSESSSHAESSSSHRSRPCAGVLVDPLLEPSLQVIPGQMPDT